jgi:hypothetical protein
MRTNLGILLGILQLLLGGCLEKREDSTTEDLESPYNTSPLNNQEISKLKKLLPGDWGNPNRAHSPASNHERILYAMTGRLRGIYQTVRYPNGQMGNSTRVSTAFMDPSGKHLIGRDSTTKGDKIEATYFVIYYSEEEGLYRGVSWTKDSRGKEKAMQMVGKKVTGKYEIRWKAYDPGRYAGNRSVLSIKSWNEFIWTITLYQHGEEHSKLTNTSILSKHWPEHQ